MVERGKRKVETVVGPLVLGFQWLGFRLVERRGVGLLVVAWRQSWQ